MDPFTAISLGSAVVGSVSKMIGGFNEKRAANEEMRRLKAQPLPQNAYDALQVPTSGLELQKEAMQRQSTQAIEMMREAGTRAIVGGVGQVTEAIASSAAQAGAKMDELMYQREIMRADEQANIEGVKEARYAAETQAAAAAAQSGQQNMMSGFAELGSLAGSFGHGQKMDSIQAGGGVNNPQPSAPPRKLGAGGAYKAEHGTSMFGDALRQITSIFKKN